MTINGKLIVRSLVRDKGYPVLNIIGLAIGFAIPLSWYSMHLW